jgi:benzoate-CoA ligase family protein
VSDLELPERLNIAERFLDERVREGRGGRLALVCGERRLTYRDVQQLADRFGRSLQGLGVEIEQRVLLALPDSPEYVGALFGILKLGAVAVMVNPALRPEEIAALLDYSRARVAIVHASCLPTFAAAAAGARHFRRFLVVGGEAAGHAAFDPESAVEPLPAEPTHRDDAAIWLFSGGTGGRPKAVPQSHGSFLNTTLRYAQATLGYRESDVTLSVPKLFFGYATGSNLFFPFSVGATSVLYPEHPTAELLFRLIREHRPTILISVPTLVHQMLAHPQAAEQDLSSLRFATSAGEALPSDLYARWKQVFGVELLDGLGTAEMWHVFVTNRPGEVRPGTLGRVVEGFEVRVCDDDGNELPAGEVGTLWVRGGSRGWGYWQESARTAQAFRGEWYVSGDLVSRDAEGYLTHHGRGDELLKVGGRWVAPQEVEGCLLQHPAVRECAVVGRADAAGLVKPHAFVVAEGSSEALAAELQAHVKERLQPYKYPRQVWFVEALPRTHLGKVDRGRLRRA